MLLYAVINEDGEFESVWRKKELAEKEAQKTGKEVKAFVLSEYEELFCDKK